MHLRHTLAWLPVEQRKPLLHRLLIVWAVSLPIALVTWMAHLGEGRGLDVSLVYAYAISTLIWLFTDVSRFGFKRLLHTQPPHYWPPLARASLMLLVGTPLGYGLGTLVGDAYAGQSTWQLRHFNPHRFMTMALTSAAISGAFVAYFYQRAKAQALAQQATEAQLRLLQTQLEPHMLFNTLANLRALIGVDPPRALTMLDHLIAYLRATLSASRSTNHPLEAEFARLRDYLELMAVRMGPRLQFTLDLPDALRQHPVPPLLLQPLVENSIRHGLEPSVQGGHIHIHARAVGQRLQLQVRDTGVGADPAQFQHAPNPGAGHGFGLHQVRERLATAFGDLGAMELIAPHAEGTCVSVTFPLKT